MTTLTITAKGQVTFRQDLLKHLGVGPGQRIEVDKLPDGRVAIRASTQSGTMSNFIGCLSKEDGRKLTINEINEITAQGWSGEQ